MWSLIQYKTYWMNSRTVWKDNKLELQLPVNWRLQFLVFIIQKFVMTHWNVWRHGNSQTLPRPSFAYFSLLVKGSVHFWLNTRNVATAGNIADHRYCIKNASSLLHCWNHTLKVTQGQARLGNNPTFDDCQIWWAQCYQSSNVEQISHLLW